MRGLYTVFNKELADYFISWRGIILFAVVLVTVVVAIFGPSGSVENIREALSTPTQFGQSQFVFLTLFTVSGTGGESFLYFITMFLVPILGISLGFDAINSEKNSGTMSRLLAQPIHRDAVFNGKFLAGIVTIAIMLTSIVLLVSGLGLRIIGVPPTSEEAFRLFLFLILTTLYGSFWLGLSMLFSVLFRRVATSALAPIAIWIFYVIFSTRDESGFQLIPRSIANFVVPISDLSTQQEIFRWFEVYIRGLRGSPIFLFQEAMGVLLVPGARTATESLQLEASGAEWMPGALPIGQTLLNVWPHLVAFVAIAAVFFAISYAKFMREEIRST